MKNMKNLLILLLAALPAAAGPIGALIPTASELVANGGEVIVYFAGQSAGHDSVLNLIDPPGFAGNPFFHNHLTAVGTSLSLGSYAAGTILRFRMDNLTSGFSYFTGPATGNPDGLLHVAHAGWGADATIPVNGILVGFEDLFGGGDLDYDDNTFVFTNVASSAGVPEPMSMSLVMAGLGVIVLMRTLSGVGRKATGHFRLPFTG